MNKASFGLFKLAVLAAVLFSLVVFNASAAEVRSYGNPETAWFTVSIGGGGGELQDRFASNGVISIFLRQTERTPRQKVEEIDFSIRVVRYFVSLPNIYGRNDVVSHEPLPSENREKHFSGKRGVRIGTGKEGLRLTTIDLADLGLEPGEYQILFRIKSLGIPASDGEFDERSLFVPTATFTIQPSEDLPPASNQ